MWHLPFFNCHKCKTYRAQIKELEKRNEVTLEENLKLHSRCLLLEEHIRLTEKNINWEKK